MKKTTNVASKSEQSNSKARKAGDEKPSRMKVRTNVKAGDPPTGDGKLGLNHNEVKVTKPAKDKPSTIKVRTSIKAGAGDNGNGGPKGDGRLAANHNETLAY